MISGKPRPEVACHLDFPGKKRNGRSERTLFDLGNKPLKSNSCILAIDQGTTGTTTVLYDSKGRPVAKAYRELPQHFPRPGWVEHDPEDIWRTVRETVNDVCRHTKRTVMAVGITNQRETTILWNRKTGKPLHNAIVWQCRRTADICASLKRYGNIFRSRTGLPLDPYFSGTKIKWLLENAKCPQLRDIAFGTVDSWLIWKLTGGKVHATDRTNASRTLLYNIRRKQWDPDLCRILDIPQSILPDARNSMDFFGTVTALKSIAGVPITGVAGDQQAALFGQCCFSTGTAKNTYGTGCFLLMNTGKKPVISRKGLITTLAADPDGGSCYALEGSVFVAGAAIQWLRDGIRILDNASQSRKASESLSDNQGVYFVPAFVGLGAPHWNPLARGIITGLTRGTGRNHIVRAAVEAMAYQTCDVIRIMELETGKKVRMLAVDGGASANDFLLQFQADLLGRPVARPAVIESTSRGAAYLAGLKAGLWKTAPELLRLQKTDRIFRPLIKAKDRQRFLDGWHSAVSAANNIPCAKGATP